MILIAARIVYYRYWKDFKIPTKDELIEKIMDVAEMDKLSNIGSTVKVNTDCAMEVIL